MVRYWRHRTQQVQRFVEPHIQKYFPFHKPELEGVSPVKATYSGRVVKAPFELALGKVVPFGEEIMASRSNIIKINLHKLCLNKFLLKYYYQSKTYWAHDQNLKVNIGDIVLVEKCDPPIAFNTVFKLKKIVFPVGDIIDPISGMKCEGPNFSVDTMQTWLKDKQDRKDVL